MYFIDGPNGAGKAIFALEFLAEFVACKEFLNADLIAAGLSPFAPETQNLRADRIRLERIADISANSTTRDNKQRCPMSTPNDQSLTELANAAFKQAAKKVIQRAMETGTPVILWENDSVKKVDPKTIIQSREAD